MIQFLIHAIVKKITVDYSRLSIVRNQDGFLAMDDVCHELNLRGLNVVRGDNLYLRVHYEREFKNFPDNQYIYLPTSDNELLPDITADAYQTNFSIADLFPFWSDKNSLRGLSLEILATIYNKYCGIRVRSYSDCHRIVEETKQEIDKRRQQSAEYISQKLEKLFIDWCVVSAEELSQLSKVMVEAIRYGGYDSIDGKIQETNRWFQQWLDDRYFSTLNSSYLLKPKSVNKILPFIADNNSIDQKVALIVIDGLAYWQYYVLYEYLISNGIQVHNDFTMAWIPTITMLSRQAIFRGGNPTQDYKQSQANEKNLWRDFWKNNGVSEYAIQYLSDNAEFSINEQTRRLAYVSVEMDEKMHSSSDYKDLLSLTENWCPRITEKIKTLKDMGFVIYLTTDHGSVLSKGWNTINSAEKVFLYKDDSRGKRHLIYNNVENKQRFIEEHIGEIGLFGREDDNWLSIRTDSCFEHEGQRIITHGGSHFWEVVIPFVKI